MLAFKDPIDAIDEPKSARLEQRTKPRVKTTIQTAAALLGVDETAFVTTVAYERARAVIKDHEITTLTCEDAKAFLSMFDSSPQATEARKRSADLFEQMVVDDESSRKPKD